MPSTALHREQIVQALSRMRIPPGAERGDLLLPARATPFPYPMRALLSHSALLRDPALRPGPGIALRLVLRLVDASPSCRPIVNAVVALWHHDWRGAPAVSGLQFPDGTPEPEMVNMQLSDSEGRVTLSTICPGALADGRTHLHLRVFLNDTVSVTAIASADLLLPIEVTQRVQRCPPYRPLSAGPAGIEACSSEGETARLELRQIRGDPEQGYRGELTLTLVS